MIAQATGQNREQNKKVNDTSAGVNQIKSMLIWVDRG
jgi:hypothetical protein